MATARDIVERSLRMIGVLAHGESASADQLADGIEALTDMLDSWSNENLIIHYFTTEDFSLVPSQTIYQMGTGLDFDSIRPVDVVNMTYKDSATSFERAIDIIPQAEYKKLSSKNTASSMPVKCFVNYNVSSVDFSFYPVPNTAKLVSITSYKPLATITNASTVVNLPAGYLRAIKTNLSIEVAPEYGLPVSQELLRSAVESKSNVKRKNKKQPRLASEVASVLSGNVSWDYRIGE